MDSQSILQRFTELNVWRRGRERAVHKPLLILSALADVQHGAPRLRPYPEVDRILRPLLEDFGPQRRTYHPEYPFWRLQSDGLWEVRHQGDLRLRESNSDPLKSELVAKAVPGGFAPAVHAALRRDPYLVAQVARTILDAHFPTSIHEDILSAVGLDLQSAAAGMDKPARKRDPEFRRKVLTTYERRCAVCRFALMLDDHSVGLEAAHIQWFSHQGPDRESNGLALCTLHHKLFDLGVYTVREDYRVLVSMKAQGYGGAGSLLLDLHGQEIHLPPEKNHRPHPEHLRWHEREVFHAPARPAA